MSGTNTRDTAGEPTHTAQSCRPVRETLSMVGDKWSVLIVVILEKGTKRFSELQHAIEGISQRMLTRTLRDLERSGLVARRVEPTVPPSVYYSLTALGETLLVPVKALGQWAVEHYVPIEKARETFDKKANAQSGPAISASPQAMDYS